MDIVVIGAGASGLVAAIFAKSESNNVTILEQYDKSAKKILATGNGRCNYWNEFFDNSCFYSTNKDFLKEVNTLESRKEVLTFFESIGITPTIKNGYYYPLSMQASSVRNALLKEADKKKINIINNSKVLKVEKKEEKFHVYLNNEIIKCDKLIVASGSNSYYKEENLGYDICKSLGHNIIKVLPSLVQLIGKGTYYKDWSGVRNNSKVSIYINDIKEKEEYGELMLTDYGLSGICIFNLSGIANRALSNNKKVDIRINFLPEIENLKEFLGKRNITLSDRKLDEFLEGLLNYKLVKVILKRINLEDRYWSSLNELEKDILIDNLVNYKVEITGSKSFDDSQVCTGGVDTTEVNPETFESKICKNLFIVGEILDVDGICGGYNLGFAWLSGISAGKCVKND